MHTPPMPPSEPKKPWSWSRDRPRSSLIRDQVKVIVGGAPVTDDFAQEIGADAYAPNASIGTEKALELVKG